MSYLVVLVAVLTRFIPHMPNFSPVFAASGRVTWSDVLGSKALVVR